MPMKTGPDGGIGLAKISEWFLPTPEKGATLANSQSMIDGPLLLDTGSVVSNKQGRDDDETAIIRTSTSEEPDEPTFLDWRMNPKTSLADWTVVISTPGRSIKYYYVHRNIIMLPSRYFRKLFKKQRKVGGRSDFHLPDEAAAVFPEFLDYMYRLGTESITHENAVPLYYLSRIFSVDRLRWEARKFWEADMALSTIAHYYEAAILFEEETLMEHVLKACTEEDILSGMDSHSAVLKNENPRMLLHIVQTADPKHSENLSGLISEFCTLHRGKMNSKVFAELTEPLTEISQEAASSLLIQERHFWSPKGVTSLQKKCISTLSKNWYCLDVMSAEFKDMLSMQDAEFLAELFQMAMLHAQGRELPSPESSDEEAPDVIIGAPTMVAAKDDDVPVDPILSARTEDEARAED